MKKILSFALVVALMLTLCLTTASCNKGDSYTVGVCQLMAHPSLDQATQGFVDALNEKMAAAGKTVDIDIQVAGDANNCPTVIGTFTARNVDLIMANATPALLAAANATATIPVLGTSVTDYPSTFGGTVPSNVSGMSDAVPFGEQAQMMIDTLGLVAGDQVGVIYCSDESNSKIQYDAVAEYFAAKGITVKAYTFSETTELQSVTALAVSESKAIYVPSDNTVANNDAVVGDICTQANTPLYTSYGGDYCYASLAIDYYELGYQTGLMAAEILLEGKSASDLEIGTILPTTQYNKTLCEALGITVPAGN